MAEIKQTNFRINQDTANSFREFCEENGMNQAQGFDHIMQIVEMDKAKAIVPERRTEIENFEKAVKDIMATYLNSVELGKTAEDRAKENFSSLLLSKDKTIADLQGKVESFKTAKEEAEQLALTSSNAAAEAIKDAEAIREQSTKETEASKEQAEMSRKLLEEKEKTLATLAEKLAKAEEKAEKYDSLSEANKKLQETVKELKHTIERKESDALKDTDLAVAKAVSEKEKEMMARIMELEKENMKLATKLEMLESSEAKETK